MTIVVEKFQTLTSRCVPLNRNNVDTDQIIPARFLKGTTKTGLGEKAFYDWRYRQDGSPEPEFVLNNPTFKGGQILVAAHNFGCGSSREHAPWALRDTGFKAVIAVSFADIFKNNSLKNHLLPVDLPEAVVYKLLEDIQAHPALEVTINLVDQTVEIPGQPTQRFEIDPFRKKCLLEGLDDIGFTMTHLEKIKQYETTNAK